MKCGVCGAQYGLKIHISSRPDYDPDKTGSQGSSSAVVDLDRPDTNEETIRRALIGYWRWVAQGQHPYQHASTFKPDFAPQYFYDSYHDSIEWIREDAYKFRIQVSDSPEGDTWMVGTFVIKGGMEIEITELRYEHN